MAIERVNKSAFASGTAGINVGAVSATALDDLILLFVESANEAITTPSGYDIIPGAQISAGTAAAAGGMRLNGFYQWATGADSTVSVADTGNHTAAIKVAYRGVDKTTPWDATVVTALKTAASTSSSYPGITTATDNALILFVSGLDLDANSTTTTSAQANGNLTGLTELHDQTTASGVGGGIVITEGYLATAGATGDLTATVTSTQQVYITIALREAPLVTTGDIDATDDYTDTAALDGTVLIQGALAATETDFDTSDISGPGGIVEGLTGTLAATDDYTDTASMAGQVIVQGALSATDDYTDTATATGKVIVTGALAATDADVDTAAATGKVLVKGALSATDIDADTSAIVGVVLVQGTLAATDADTDTAALAGQVIVQGTISATDDYVDTSVITSAPAALDVTGTIAATEEDFDTAALVGKVIVQGALSGTDDYTDTASASGVVLVKGTINVTETSQDTIGGYAEGYADGYVGGESGEVLIRGLINAFETDSDTAALLGRIYITGDVYAVEEALDTMFATGGAIVRSTGPSARLSTVASERFTSSVPVNSFTSAVPVYSHTSYVPVMDYETEVTP